MNLSEKLRNAREHAGLSQTEASTLTGINYKTLNNYEHGVSKPDVGKLAAICRVYKISADYFIKSDYNVTKSSPVSAEAETGELSEDVQQLLTNYSKLNDDGKEAARDSVEALTCLPKYKKCDNSQEMA